MFSFDRDLDMGDGNRRDYGLAKLVIKSSLGMLQAAVETGTRFWVLAVTLICLALSWGVRKSEQFISRSCVTRTLSTA